MTTLLGVAVETRGGGQHDGGTVVAEVRQQPLAELVAVVDRQLADGVEGTLGVRAEAAGDLVDALDDDVAAAHILLHDVVKVLLRRVNGGLSEDLAERRWRQTGLGQTHHGAEELAVARDDASHTGTAGAVALRHRVEQHDIVLAARQVEHREVLLAVVAELAVHLVGKEVQVVLLAECADSIEVFLAVQVARRVVGVAYHDGTRVGRDVFLKVVHQRQGETALDVAPHGDDLGVAELGEGVVVGVIGLGDDDLVAGVEAAGESHLQSLAAAGGHQYALGRDVDAVLLVVLAQLLAVALYTGAGAVGQHVDLGVRQLLQGSLRGLDVGLADVQVVHVYAVGLGGVGERYEFAYCRLRQLKSFMRNVRHCFPVLS